MAPYTKKIIKAKVTGTREFFKLSPLGFETAIKAHKLKPGDRAVYYDHYGETVIKSFPFTVSSELQKNFSQMICDYKVSYEEIL